MIISFREESFIKAKKVFNKVVEFVSHGSSSPFCLRCHYKTRRGILLAKIKKIIGQKLQKAEISLLCFLHFFICFYDIQKVTALLPFEKSG